MPSDEKKPTFKIPIFLVGLLLATFLIWGVWSYLWWGMGRDRTVRQLLQTPSDWPHTVKELHDTLLNNHPDLSMDGYLMCGAPGPFSVDEAAFRIHESTPTIYDALKSGLELVEIEPDHPMAGWGRIVVEKATSEWWAHPDDKATYYASKNLLDGEEGPLYVVAYSPVTHTIYVSYHFNF